MAKKERPEIELYLYSINQEFPVEKGHATFLKRHSETSPDINGKLVGIEEVARHTYKTKVTDWPAQWIHNQWVENWTKTGGAEFGTPIDRLGNLILRKEDFGGIVLDPVADEVYRVNKPGLILLEEILSSHKRGKLKDFKSKKYKAGEIEHFIYFLKGAGLWQT
jgi:hypothetical protein